MSPIVSTPAHRQHKHLNQTLMFKCTMTLASVRLLKACSDVWRDSCDEKQRENVNSVSIKPGIKQDYIRVE